MPQYSIQAPNGKTYQIEGPEGASQEQVQAEVLRQYPEAAGGIVGSVTDTGVGDFMEDPEFQQQLAAEQAPPEGPPDETMLGKLKSFGLGAVKPLDNLVLAAREIPGVAAADNYLADLLGMQNGAEVAASNQAQREADPNWGARFAGNIAGTLPTLALPGGILTQGAASGALLSDSTDAGGVAMDAAFGAAAGKVGEVALRGVAGAVAPRIPDSLRTLINAGVEVTPGQAARSRGGTIGEFLARNEDKAVSTPFVGDRIVAGRNKSLKTFGRATINRALEPIGMSLPKNVSGRKAVQYAGDRLGEAYDAVLPRISATGDQQFVSDIAAIHQEAGTMLPQRLDQFNNILSGLDRYWQNGVRLDGAALKEIEERIGERVRRAAMSTDADQRELGDRLGDVLGAVRELAARQNPAEAGALRSINQGWKSLTQVERAAGNSTDVITPAGYSQAVRQSSDTVRRRGYARGEALNQDLSDAASEVLPSQIADSGTAGRWQQSNMLANLIGAAQAPVYSAASKATGLMTRDASPTQRTIADMIRYGAQAMPAIAPASIHAISD